MNKRLNSVDDIVEYGNLTYFIFLRYKIHN